MLHTNWDFAYQISFWISFANRTLAVKYVSILNKSRNDRKFSFYVTAFTADAAAAKSCAVTFGGDRSYSVYGVHLLLGAVLVAELDVVVQVVVHECDCVVDADRLRELTVRLEISCLVRCVLEDDVRFRVLVVTQADKDDVALVDPDLWKK